MATPRPAGALGDFLYLTYGIIADPVEGRADILKSLIHATRAENFQAKTLPKTHQGASRYRLTP